MTGEFVNKGESQSIINNFIMLLAESSYSMDDIKSKVEDSIIAIYKDPKFRHSYSQIFATIKTQIMPSDKYNIDFLSMNVETLYDLNDRDNGWGDEVKNKINKLCDHIMLETSRMGYFNNQFAQYQDLEKQLKDNTLSVRKTGKKLKDASKELTKAQATIDSLRSESVTVLSIFAAIMLAGIGGFSVLGNFVKAVSDISNYRFFITASFLGLILFNVVFMLIYMIARLTGKNIYTICTDSHKDINSDCVYSNCNNNCCGINRVRKRLPYIFWSNVILADIIVISLFIEHVDLIKIMSYICSKR